MSKLGTANINIGANLKPLQEGMKNARELITKNISRMSRSALSGIGSLITGFVRKIVSAVKYASAALAAFVATSIWAASKQQDAEVKLAAALKATKQYTDETMDSLKDYASELQQVSTVGDETSLAMMQVALSLGVQAARIPHVVKGSIALSRAIGMNESSLVRYLALAEQGEFTMLQRYIPALRFAADETEKMAILNNMIAESMEIAEAETWTFSGALKQMRNAMGDAMERFGGPFLKIFIKTFKELKKWFEDNEDEFEEWGKVVNEHLENAISDIKSLFKLAKAGQWDLLKQKFADIGAAITNSIIRGLKFIAPHAENLGKHIGRGFLDVAKEILNQAGPAIAEAESLKRAAGSAASIGGVYAGGTAGAAIGTAIAPGIGTLIGGGVGMAAGWGGGRVAVDQMFKSLEGSTEVQTKALKENTRQVEELNRNLTHKTRGVIP